MPLKLKTTEIEGKTYALVSGDGKPLYDDDGKEIAFDAPQTVSTISRLNGEARDHRVAKEAAETKLQSFERITDVDAAVKALETVANLDAKKLIDAGEVERVKADMAKTYQGQIDTANQERDAARNELNSERIAGAFGQSKFIKEKIAIPSDMVRTFFGSNFSYKDGNLIATDSTGNQIYSKSSPGNPAGFDEAIEILVDQYPYKEQILKGNSNQGGGSQQGQGDNRGDGKTMTRAAFDKLPHPEKAKAMSDGIQLVDA